MGPVPQWVRLGRGPRAWFAPGPVIPIATIGVALYALLLTSSSCSERRFAGFVHANQRPSVRLTQSPAPGPTAASYRYEFSWAGSDPDGRVASFRYVIDAPGGARADTAWTSTHENRRVFVFRADSVSGPTDSLSHRYHTFAVEAVDDQGAVSAPAVVSFDASTVAPSVSITRPVPSAIGEALVPPSVRISWTGDDPDGILSHEPVGYRYRLFAAATELTAQEVLLHPDTLRTRYAPGFAGWDSVPSPVHSVALHDLVPRTLYVFAITALDTAGAYTPVFRLDTNVLAFIVDVSGALGPTITLWNSSFSYTYPSGGFTTDPAWVVHQQFAAEVPVPLAWSAMPAPGGFIRGYRWSVDIAALDDETPRSNEVTDLAHWSRWTTAGSTLLPAFHPPPGVVSETHRFYLEADDDAGLRSLAILEFQAVRATFDRPLLIVNDTWFNPDRRLANGCVDRPRQAWPSAAELDTFLFAVGGKPWQCYPAGTLSSPGLFTGYGFDTIGAHHIALSALTLDRLAHYRNVIWMTDAGSAIANEQFFNSAIQPMPLLRELSKPNVTNPLAAWLLQGGRLWLLGGGAAYASLRDYSTTARPTNVFSNDQGELVAGRFMFSQVHWQSELTVYQTQRVVRSSRAVGGWPGAPDYSALPDELDEKSAATDPLPPQRTASDGYYAQICYAEYLTRPNAIIGPIATPKGTIAGSVLDTLFETRGGGSGGAWPVATLYHGSDSGPLLFAGVPLWYFRRDHAIALIDFVLQELWGMTKAAATQPRPPAPQRMTTKRPTSWTPGASTVNR